MSGQLRLNSNGRWEIVRPFGERVEITSGTMIEVYVYSERRWIPTRIESRCLDIPPYTAEYYSVDGIPLYSGLPARTV
jgi:hypothetical protein